MCARFAYVADCPGSLTNGYESLRAQRAGLVFDFFNTGAVKGVVAKNSMLKQLVFLVNSDPLVLVG